MAAYRYSAILLFVMFVTAVVLSLVWRVPYIYTAAGFACWAFLGHLVTADDDFRGGWSNPDGSRRFPWGGLLIKAVIFIGLCWLIVSFPAVKSFGTGG